MSFSSEIKEELSKVSNHNNDCCKLAELAGYLITNCNIVRDKDRFVLKMVTSSSSAIRRVYNAFRKIYGVIPITNIEKEEEGKEQLYELIVSNSDDLEKIFKNSLVNIDVNLQIVIDDGGRIKEKECCMRSFLRGVFLGSGSINEPGKPSPFRNRSVEENLRLFEEMKEGKYADGEKVLRAKIDMASPNMNMRDPVIYRVAHMTHHRTGDTWCIYPMYDFAHPIEDAIEGITHSICTLEFEDHRPLYDWVVRELEYPMPPRQIEFAKLYLTNVVTGKRYIKKLVDQGIVDGWDDPRLVTIAALRRRGYTPESIKMFMEMVGVSKSNSSVDYAMLEYCIREDLKMKRSRMMAVLHPLKLVIDNYPEGQIEYLDVPNNQENEALGTRKVPFGRELYIEQDDFMEVPPKKYFRLYPGNEVRLMSAYFVTCTDVVKDEAGNVVEVHCTYDPETKSGSGFTGRKVKGTIHWVAKETAVKAEVRLYENLVDESKGSVYNEDGSVNINPNSLTVLKDCCLEPNFEGAVGGDSYQFVRNGFFCIDSKDSKPDALVFNRIVSLKSSFKLNK